MRLNHQEEKIVRMLTQGMASPEEIAKKLGNGYTKMKAQSMVLTLARKGAVDKTKAAIILAGSPMLNFLSYERGAGLKKI